MHGVQAGILVLYKQGKKVKSKVLFTPLPLSTYLMLPSTKTSLEKLQDETTEHFPIINLLNK